MVFVLKIHISLEFHYLPATGTFLLWLFYFKTTEFFRLSFTRIETNYTMSKKNNTYDDLEEFDNLASIPPIRNIPQREYRHKYRNTPHKKKITHLQESLNTEIAEQVSSQGEFNFSYNASRHERKWIMNSLGGFFDGQWLDDVLRLLKGGKEASVYQCTISSEVNIREKYLAAKVYRPRRFRNLKNDHLYREGRKRLDENGHEIHDGRMSHAMMKRTEFGKRLLHTSWIEHEFNTMQILHSAGCDIPEPYSRGNNAILMEYIGWADMPAPTLNTVHLDRDEAVSIFEKIVHNIQIMLASQRIHGDFSAYNVLYRDGDIKIIDFPQAINPIENQNSYLIFKRDIRRICEYFNVQGVNTDWKKLSKDLWISHGYLESIPIHPGLLDDQDEGDYTYWIQKN